MGILKEDATEVVNLSIKFLQSKACNIIENKFEKKKTSSPSAKGALKGKTLAYLWKTEAKINLLIFIMNNQ